MTNARTYRIRTATSPLSDTLVAHGSDSRLEVLDDDNDLILASCAFEGRAALARIEFTSADGMKWALTPSRRVMPTFWTVSADNEPAVVIKANYWRSFLNPLNRMSLKVLNASERELFRVLDDRTSKADRLLGSGPKEWLFRVGDETIGKLIRLPRPAQKGDGPIRRVLGRLGSDTGFVSFGSEHILSAPASLALALIHRDLTDPS